MRLIDADALLEAIYKNDGWDYHLTLHTIKNAPSVQREGWIGVDRLPSIGEWYLIFVNGIVTMAFLDSLDEEKNALWLPHNDKDDSECWENVTHWQPLPAAPTCEKEKG